MVAVAHERRIEMYDELLAFYGRTGLIYSFSELMRLGFAKDDVTGAFRSDRIAELLEYCAKRPAFHVITMTQSGRYENRYVPGKKVYYLADGDKNPYLVLNLFLQKSPDLFAEEGLAKALAMPD